MKLLDFFLASSFLLAPGNGYSAIMNGRVPYQHRRLLLGGSRHGELTKMATRRLNEVGVSEFCSNLGDIEEYLAVQIIDLYDDRNFEIITESGNYVCVCSSSVIESNLRLDCSAHTTLNYPATANVEHIELELQDDGTYMPLTTEWCEFNEGRLDGASYCESYTFDSNDTSMLASCVVQDTFCEAEIACQICEGGQTVSIISETCLGNGTDIICGDNYTGAFLFGYHLDNPLDEIYKEEEVVDEGCSSTESPFLYDFCNDLSDVESNITDALGKLVSPENIVSNYSCSCYQYLNVSAISVECNATYFDDISGGYRDNTEAMILTEQNGYLVVSVMEWCDYSGNGIEGNNTDDFYCDYYEFGLGQEKLAYCELGGCQAGFCELCSNGVTVGNSCFENTTCSDDYTGSFLFAYRDTKLAKRDCTSEPATMAPTTLPPTTVAPISTPSPTVAPVPSTNEPTVAPVQSTPAETDEPIVAPVPTTDEPMPTDREPGSGSHASFRLVEIGLAAWIATVLALLAA